MSDVWIVDSGTKKVYQYTAAAGRTSGSQSASAVFALAAGNTNPQDIADPPPADTLLIPAAPPLVLSQPPAVAFSAMPVGGVAAAPSLAPRDVAFALLARESLPGAPALGFPASGALTPRPDSPMPPGPSAGQQPLDAWPSLSPGSGYESRAQHGALSDEDVPTAAADDFAAGLKDEAPPEE